MEACELSPIRILFQAPPLNQVGVFFCARVENGISGGLKNHCLCQFKSDLSHHGQEPNRLGDCLQSSLWCVRLASWPPQFYGRVLKLEKRNALGAFIWGFESLRAYHLRGTTQIGKATGFKFQCFGIRFPGAAPSFTDSQPTRL